jgi:hypothetical protein
VRTWRPLFFWLLDITLTNCFILWRLQVRRAPSSSRVDWNPVEFNRALASALLVHEPASTAGQATTNTSTRVTKGLKSIAPNRCREALSGILSAVEAATDLKSVLLARGHIMCKGEGTRREYVGCKYEGKASRGQLVSSTERTNVEFASKVNTRCVQCNVYLCRKGKCWEGYYNSKKPF